MARHVLTHARKAALVALGLLVAGCSLTRVDVSECGADADCREAFGPGSACQPDGTCAMDVPSRCEALFPDDLFERPADYRERIPVGVIVELRTTTLNARAAAVQLAAETVSQLGGIGDEGKELAVVACGALDGGNFDVDASVADGLWLIDTLGAPAIVGPAASSTSLALLQALDDRDVVLVSPSATSDSLSAAEPPSTDEAPGRFWRTAAPDSLQSIAMVLDLRSRGVTSIGVLHESDAYGEGLAASLEELFTGAGESIRLIPFTEDPTPALQLAAADASLEELVIVGRSTQARTTLLFASQNPALDGRGFFLSDGGANTDILEAPLPSDAVLSRVRATRPAAPDGIVYFNLRGSLNAEFGLEADNFSFVAQSYDALFVLALGMVWADARGLDLSSGASIARGMRRLSDGPEAPLGATAWDGVVDALGADQSVDVRGASGEIDFDPATRQVVGDIEVLDVDTSAPGEPELRSLRRYLARELESP